MMRAFALPGTISSTTNAHAFGVLCNKFPIIQSLILQYFVSKANEKIIGMSIGVKLLNHFRKIGHWAENSGVSSEWGKTYSFT